MRTSVNLRFVDLPKLDDACEKTGKGYSLLLCLCLKKLFTYKPLRLRTSLINRLVEYQPDGLGYHIQSIVFDVDVYNLAVNFRVFSRVSVSKMATIAINLYLDDVVDELLGVKKSEHNYVGYHHSMRHNEQLNATQWFVEWIISDKNVEKHPKQIRQR